MFSKALDWVVGNKIAMYVIGAVLLIIGFKGVKWNERRKGRKQGRERVLRQIEKKTNRVRSAIDDEEDTIDELFERRGVRDVASTHRDNRRRPVR